MILVDTSGLVAALFPDQLHHRECARILSEAKGPFVLSPFVLAEIDYLVSKLAGVSIELALLEDVAAGAYEVATFDASDVGRALRVAKQYKDLALGLADASIVVLANRLQIKQVLTLDERHFRAVTASDGQPFRILPADGFG